MKGTRSAPLLQSSVDRAAVSIVTARLDAASRAAERVDGLENSEALHDFRVGMRRLRSALRAYRPWLGKASSRRLRDALRDLARSTNEDRDAEVEIEWIRACCSRAPAAIREELASYVRHAGGKAPSRRKLVAQFRRFERTLRRRLQAVEPCEAAFSDVYASLIAEHVERAAACLAAIQAADDVVPAHRARIAVKKLRYLLEPLSAELRPLRACVECLAELQDVLGELHDAHVFAEHRCRRPGAWLGKEASAFVLARNVQRRDRLFDRLQARWLGGGMDGTWKKIRRALPPS